jgi:hypothetical protein
MLVYTLSLTFSYQSNLFIFLFVGWVGFGIDYISNFGELYGPSIQIQPCQLRETEFTISEPIGSRIS